MNSWRAMALGLALLLPAVASAQSPREHLNQLVIHLRGNPGDTALRERIIRLAQEIKPAPAVPEEAERRMGRGQAAFEIAKEPADFDRAIAEFAAASNEAPWLAAAYYNLAVAQEKAKRYREAMANLRLYVLAAPGAPDLAEVRQRIFKLEYLAEQPPPAPSNEELLRRVSGARFMRSGMYVLSDSKGDHVFEISGKQILFGWVIREAGPFDRQHNRQAFNLIMHPAPDWVHVSGLKWQKSREISCPDMFRSWSSCTPATLEVSPDGRSLRVSAFNFSTRAPDSATFLRSN